MPVTALTSARRMPSSRALKAAATPLVDALVASPPRLRRWRGRVEFDDASCEPVSSCARIAGCVDVFAFCAKATEAAATTSVKTANDLLSIVHSSSENHHRDTEKQIRNG